MSIDEMILLLQKIKDRIGGEQSVLVETPVGGTFDYVGICTDEDMADGSKIALIFGW